MLQDFRKVFRVARFVFNSVITQGSIFAGCVCKNLLYKRYFSECRA